MGLIATLQGALRVPEVPRSWHSDWGVQKRAASYLLRRWQLEDLTLTWLVQLALNPIAIFSFSTWCSTFASPWWAPAAVQKNGRLLIKFGPFHNPQKSAYTTAPCVKVSRCLSQPDWALQIRSPLCPALRLMVKGFHEKSANRSVPWELRTVRRQDKRLNAEPEPSARYWHWKILRSSNHQSRKLSRAPPPVLWKLWTASGRASLQPSAT